MDFLDTSANYEYNSITGKTGIKCLNAYSGSVEFRTIVDDKYTGINEQRRDAWTNPKRTWILEFEKDPNTARMLDSFFCKQKGKYKSFLWTWDEIVDGIDFGGDGKNYIVRFTEDKLDFKAMEMGYKTFSISITMLREYKE